MAFAGRFLIVLVAFIAFQAACARPYFTITRWTNLGYEINKVVDDSHREIRKDLLNAKNKIWRETSKIINRARGDNDVMLCVTEEQVRYLSALDQSSVEAITCIEQVRDDANAIDNENHSAAELSSMRNGMKKTVKECRNRFKDQYKEYEKNFSHSAERCPLNPGRVLDAFE